MTKEELTQKVNELTAKLAAETDATKKPAIQAELDAAKAELDAINAAENAAANAPKTYDEIVAVLKSNTANKDLKVTIASVQLDQRTGKSGREYWNLMMTLDKPIIGVSKDENGAYKPAYIRTIQMPYWQLELAMRGNNFFGRFIQYIADAIEAGFGDQFIAGLTMNIIAEFVPAGTDAKNPFTRKENKYGIKEYDRYIYHVVGVERPTDELLLQSYKDAVVDTRDAMREAMKARRAAKAARASFLASATSEESTDDVPF